MHFILVLKCCFDRWSTHWFKLELEVPDSWIGEEVRLIWDAMTEAMVWKNGEPVQVTNLPITINVCD